MKATKRIKRQRKIVQPVGDDLQVSYDLDGGKGWRVIIIEFTAKGRRDWGNDVLHMEFKTLKKIAAFVEELEKKGYGKS